MENAVVAVPAPDWEGVRDTLQRRHDNEQKIFGGTFYPTVLRKWRDSGHSKWRTVKKAMSTVDREVKTLQLLFASMPKDQCAAYATHPCRATFDNFPEQFRLERARSPVASGPTTHSSAPLMY